MVHRSTEIQERIQEWGLEARACVCIKNKVTGMGHAIVVENSKDGLKFLDVQINSQYNINNLDLSKNDVMFFRIDKQTISSRGVNACEKE